MLARYQSADAHVDMPLRSSQRGTRTTLARAYSMVHNRCDRLNARAGICFHPDLFEHGFHVTGYYSYLPSKAWSETMWSRPFLRCLRCGTIIGTIVTDHRDTCPNHAALKRRRLRGSICNCRDRHPQLRTRSGIPVEVVPGNENYNSQLFVKNPM